MSRGAAPGCPYPRLLSALVLLGATAYLLAYLRPSLLLAPTTATGGDMATHFQTARYLHETLLPSGRLLGWDPGGLAGYPIFQLYFPLPFLLTVPLTPFLGLQAAFKLVTVLGTLLLAPAAWGALRLFGHRRPVPEIGAICTLPFLLHEANSVWGGNLPSTLAGEFAYSLGLALALLFAGACYRGLTGGRLLMVNALLLALVGLSHAYTLLVAGAVSASYALWLPGRRRNLLYLGRLWALAFALLGFWIVPLLLYSPYTTPYRDVWRIDSWIEILPPIFWPFLGVTLLAGVAGLARTIRERRPSIDPRTATLAGLVWVAVALYFAAPRLGVVDIRFLPFAQLGLLLAAAPPLGAWLRRRPGGWAAVPLALLATFAWCDRHVGYIPQWIDWNYSGFERRPLWPAFSEVNRYLEGDASDPRVVFEHSAAHNAAGSIRAFESLPLFAGRSTLEGLYIQSSLNSPAIFYAQSEYSESASCPLPEYHCGRLDAERAAEHLRQFNVGQIVARSDRVKAALAASAQFTLEAVVPPYEIHRVEGGEGRYVVPLAYEPVALRSEDWKRDFFRWFKRPGTADVALVRVPPSAAADDPLAAAGPLPEGIPRRAIAGSPPRVEERIGADEIRIRTSRPGHPLLVRISYHPRWRVDGAERIHLAAPGFMLLYPERHEVRLHWADPPPVLAGRLLSLLGLAAVAAGALAGLARRLRAAPAGGALDPRPVSGSAVHGAASEHLPSLLSGRRALVALLVPLALVLAAAAASRIAARDYAPVLWERGIDRYHREELPEAEALFARAIESDPLSSAAVHASFYRALVSYRQGRCEETVARLEEMNERFPESTYRAEGEYHIGLCRRTLGQRPAARRAFESLAARFPGSEWAGHARRQLGGLS